MLRRPRLAAGVGFPNDVFPFFFFFLFSLFLFLFGFCFFGVGFLGGVVSFKTLFSVQVLRRPPPLPDQRNGLVLGENWCYPPVMTFPFRAVSLVQPFCSFFT